MLSFAAGLGTGLSLILAIGAQNAFVLKQGLLRHHVFAVCLFCAVSDALLIALGVAGMTSIALAAPWLLVAMKWGDPDEPAEGSRNMQHPQWDRHIVAMQK